jgi:hypothetical protein
MKKPGEHIRVNFGHSPFVFDIDGMMTASIFNIVILRNFAIASCLLNTLAHGKGIRLAEPSPLKSTSL